MTRAGALVADPDEEGASPYLSLEWPDDDAHAVLESASVRYRIAVGPIAGRKTVRLQVPGALSTATQVTKRLTASRDGDGPVVHELKRPFRDGITEFLFEPLDFQPLSASCLPRH